MNHCFAQCVQPCVLLSFQYQIPVSYNFLYHVNAKSLHVGISIIIV